MKFLLVLIICLAYLYCNDAAHLNFSKKKDGISSVITKVQDYITILKGIVEDEGRFSQEVKKSPPQTQAIDLTNKIHRRKSKRIVKKDQLQSSNKDNAGLKADEVLDHNPIHVDEKVCEEMKKNGQECTTAKNHGDDLFVVYVEDDKSNNGKRQIHKSSEKWPLKHPIHYTINDGSFTDKEIQLIKDSVEHFNNVFNCGNQKWEYISPGDQSIEYRVVFYNGTGCWSYLGYLGKVPKIQEQGYQVISLGRGCLYRGTILHEMLHTMGFQHEQNRADRDQYVTIHWDYIKPEQKSNFKKLEESEVHDDSENLSEYDYKSVMHYPKDGFSINRTLFNTITVKENNTAGVTNDDIGKAEDLSEEDKKELRLFYECDTSLQANILTDCDQADANCQGGVFNSDGTFKLSVTQPCNNCDSDIEIPAENWNGDYCYQLQFSNEQDLSIEFYYILPDYYYQETLQRSFSAGSTIFTLKLPNYWVTSSVLQLHVVTADVPFTISNMKVLRKCNE